MWSCTRHDPRTWELNSSYYKKVHFNVATSEHTWMNRRIWEIKIDDLSHNSNLISFINLPFYNWMKVLSEN